MQETDGHEGNCGSDVILLDDFVRHEAFAKRKEKISGIETSIPLHVGEKENLREEGEHHAKKTVSLNKEFPVD